MLVAVAGDWHGRTTWACARVAEAASRGATTILHVGDFGTMPAHREAGFIDDVERACERHGVTIMVTLGNHDDWGQMSARWRASRERRAASGQPGQPDAPLLVAPHILVLPRGFRWQMGGRSFVSLGGASSINYDSLIVGRSWWFEEVPTQDEVEACAAGGYADVMILHETPDVPYATPAVTDLLRYNPMGWPSKALAYSASSRALITQALVDVGPRLVAHGHMHVFDEARVRLPGRDYDTRVWSLDREKTPLNVRYLDTETLTAV